MPLRTHGWSESRGGACPCWLRLLYPPPYASTRSCRIWLYRPAPRDAADRPPPVSEQHSAMKGSCALARGRCHRRRRRCASARSPRHDRRTGEAGNASRRRRRRAAAAVALRELAAPRYPRGLAGFGGILAYRAVNTAMVQAYWQVGRLIVEHEQGGRKRGRVWPSGAGRPVAASEGRLRQGLHDNQPRVPCDRFTWPSQFVRTA